MTITYVEPTVQRIAIAKQGAAGTTLHRCGVLARTADSEYRSDELLLSSGGSYLSGSDLKLDEVPRRRPFAGLPSTVTADVGCCQRCRSHNEDMDMHGLGTRHCCFGGLVSLDAA